MCSFVPLKTKDIPDANAARRATGPPFSRVGYVYFLADYVVSLLHVCTRGDVSLYRKSRPWVADIEP